TAVETALGGRIQNVVCDDDASAREAIDSLKKNRAGRLTFLPVSSVRGNFKRDSFAEGQRGFIGFGPDCVKADKMYDDIIANLLGRVIIADNIDHAIAMSKKVKGFRIVTLDGEVISGSGAITGGRYKHKTANILDRKAEIAGLNRTLEEKTGRIAEIDKRLTDVEGEIARQEKLLAELDEAIRQGTIDLLEKDNEIRLAETALRDLKSDAERLEAELKNIDSERERSRTMEAGLRSRIEADEKLKTDSESKAEARLEEYSELKEKFDLVSEDITAARIQVNTCESNLEHIADMLRRADQSIGEARADIESRKQQIEQLAREKSSITSGHDDVDGLIADKEREKTNLQEYMSEINDEKAELSRTITVNTEIKDGADARISDIRERKYQLDIKKAKNETQLENLKEKLWEDFEISYAQALDQRREDFALSSAVKENRQIRARMKELGEVNVGAIEEYKEEKKRYDFLTEQRDDIQEAMDAICSIIDDLDKTIRLRFKTSFDEIVVNFEARFKELFGGGHAELRLSDENDPLESDIDIIAQPPGKKLQNINLLSGGEKTLTAIALMFAVLEAKPTPFCILDEVESALDDANIDRFIDCLRTLQGIQFTLVTHQKATMEHADVLYGVTMPEKGVSRVLSLNMADSAAVL
ncbi:MAG: hypothetical protein IJV66_00070, partial [Firmicutes bacterium]|nr:hypothetical protein [Bacillota bacterium]